MRSLSSKRLRSRRFGELDYYLSLADHLTMARPIHRESRHSLVTEVFGGCLGQFARLDPKCGVFPFQIALSDLHAASHEYERPLLSAT